MLLWHTGALCAVLVAATAWKLIDVYLERAHEQDLRLLKALRQLESGGREAPALPPQMLYRLGGADGEGLAGSAALPPYPWMSKGVSVAVQEFYISHSGGALLRAVAATHPGGRAGGAMVVQVAEPWSMRCPRWGEVWGGELRLLYAAAAVLFVTSWIGMRGVMAALARARDAVGQQGEHLERAAIAEELRPIIDRTRLLAIEQQAWVDEQKRFVANASHQLRTPMAVLRAQLQSALAGDLPTAEVLTQMLHTVDRAAGLADHLLSLTKLEQVKRQGGLRQVDVREVARHAVLELSPLIAAKRLDFTLDELTFRVPADAQMLGELLRNLLANAIHHAPERARVGVVLRQVAGRDELIVWDEGPGIDDELRPRLFHPFAAGNGGVGLGLSICRQIAEAMGAEVQLHNRCDDGVVIGVDAVVTWSQGP